MTNKTKYKSDAFEAIHSSASALLKIGAIDKSTMRDFNESCLLDIPDMKLSQIKKIRKIIM